MFGDSKEAEKWGSFRMEKKGGFRCPLSGGCWFGDDVDGLPRCGLPNCLGKHVWLFLVGSKLEAETKIYRSYQAVIKPLPFWVYCYKGYYWAS